MKHQYQDGTLCLYFEGEFDNLSVMKLKEPSIRLIESLGGVLQEPASVAESLLMRRYWVERDGFSRQGSDGE